MKIYKKSIDLSSQKKVEIIDITQNVQEIVKESRIKDGIVVLHSNHTTSCIKVNENEKRLIHDIETLFEKLVPDDHKCLHDDLEFRDCPPDERINGQAHLRAMLLNTSKTLIVSDSEILLGKWQSIFFIELDGAQNRIVNIMII